MGRGGRRPDESGIEFLKPDARAFVSTSADGFVDVGEGRPDEFDGDEASRSPLVTLATGLGVLGLLAVGIIAAAPWRSEPAAAPVARPESSTTTTSVPAEPTATTDVLTIETVDTAPGPDSGYVATETPPDFEVAGLYTTNALAPPGWLELYATPGASRTVGSWFAIQIIEHDPYLLKTGAERVLLGEHGVGLLSHTSDGISVLSFSLGSEALATLTAHGWADPDLVSLASGMGHIGLRPSFDESLTNGHEALFAGRSSGRSIDEHYVYGDARAAVLYRRRADDSFISIGVSSVEPAADTLARFVLAEAPDFSFSGPSVRIAINDRRMTIGVVPGLDGLRTAQWIEHDERVTVVSDLSMVDLLDVLGTVRGATAEMWRDAMMEARGFGPTGPTGAPSDEAGHGVLAVGGGWRVDLDTTGNFAILTTARGYFSQELFPHDEPLHLFSTSDATVIIARLPSMSGAGLRLRVDGSWGSTEVALEPAGAIGTPFVATYVFSELGPFTASLIDVDGTQIATISRTTDETTVIV